MRKSVTRFGLPLLIVLSLGGCGIFGEDKAPKEPGVQELYDKAKEALDDSNYELAIKSYEALQARYPYGSHAQQAELELAYAQYKQGDTTAAVAAAERFIKNHPNHANVDYAYYIKGLANFKSDAGPLSHLASQDVAERDMKPAHDAFETFKELITRFPFSKYAEDAGKRMVFLQNNMAAHEVYTASYYFRRGAWLAAANRAQGVIKDYPRAPACEKALFIMARSYHELGITDLEKDAIEVLKKNFPKSSLITPAELGKTPWWDFWSDL
jgi:outer membrane protein assembly factor BamD